MKEEFDENNAQLATRRFFILYFSRSLKDWNQSINISAKLIGEKDKDAWVELKSTPQKSKRLIFQQIQAKVSQQISLSIYILIGFERGF